MKYGVIDIGSNSVRLMMSEDTNTLYKVLETTQLSEGLALTGELTQAAMQRTVDAIERFYKKALNEGAVKIYPFATEAVRSANNKDVFIKMLNNRGIDIDVVPSQNEAILGFSGAYTDGQKAVMDIGGASTEIAVGNQDGLIYAKSVPIGIVRIKDKCLEDKEKINNYINEMLSQYGEVPDFEDILAIGGTPSSFVSIYLKMKVYDTKKVDFYQLTQKMIRECLDKIENLSFEDRLKVDGLSPKRRDVIVGAGYLLLAIMKKFNKSYVIVRESDNLEGYLKYKLGLISKLS